MYVCVFMYVCMLYVCYIYLCMCVDVCMYICMYVPTYALIYEGRTESHEQQFFCKVTCFIIGKPNTPP